MITPARSSRFTTPWKRSRAMWSCSLRGWRVIDCRISSMWRVPSRQGMHLPQLSRWMKSMKNLATSTMQLSSSMTTRPPEPIMAPSSLSDS